MRQSPFPGMDPYLESHWPDVHMSLIADMRIALNRVLPDDLAASAEERLAVESDTDDELELEFRPDLHVVRISETRTGIDESSPVGTIRAPVRLTVQVEPATERFIRIVAIGTERLITIIELISPSNKRGRGLVDFRSKRVQLLEAGVNFVEIDLVRAGAWRSLLRPHVCPKKWVTPYRVTVRLPKDTGTVEMYPISIRDPLPTISIPLRKKDREVHLELQRLLTQTYENGRYARRLDYREPLQPPLDAADLEWAAARIATHYHI